MINKKNIICLYAPAQLKKTLRKLIFKSGFNMDTNNLNIAETVNKCVCNLTSRTLTLKLSTGQYDP